VLPAGAAGQDRARRHADQRTPIAADARREGDGKRMALLKVVAGLIALPFDDVRKREAIADTRRIKIMAAGVAIVAVLGMLAGYLAWDRQLRNDNIAAIAKKTESANETTQALVRQLLASSPPQAAPGREQSVSTAVADIAKRAAEGDARLQQALDLLKAGKVEEASQLLQAFADDKSARIKQDSKEAAIAWRNLGAIAGLRDPKRARDAFARAVALDPDDAESLLLDGQLEFDAGDLNAAERSYRRLLALKQAESDSSEAYWARLGLGDIEQSRGRLDPALASYRAAQLRAERIAKADPGNAGWQRDLSVSYVKIGDVLVAQGNLPEALKSFRASHDIFDRLAQADPGNAGWQRDLSVSYERIGDVLVAQGNLPEALKSFRDELAIRDRLAKADPGNAGWQSDLAVSHAKLASVFGKGGEKAKALDALRQGRAIMARMTSLSPDNAVFET
jgi:tetratricopeptide (TPR) repeat protein